MNLPTFFSFFAIAGDRFGFLESSSNIGIYLACALFLYLLLLYAGRLFKRHLGIPLTWVYRIFSLLASIYLPTLLPQIRFPGEEHLEASAILSGAFVAVGLIRHFFFEQYLGKGKGAQVPKFLSEFVSIAVIIAASLLVLQFVYGKEVPGLLAGAGIAGIVLGLALQDTLGNIFSGFAIYFGGQFKAGDWLLVDGYHAKIQEINWRSTRLITLGEVCIDIPNSVITKQTVVNFSNPTTLHSSSLEIGLEYNAAPSVVQKVLVDAARDCPWVVGEPAPSVFLTNFADWSVTYQLNYWISDHAFYNKAASHIRCALWYSLRRNKIAIPYPLHYEVALPAPIPPEENRAQIRHCIEKTVFAPALSSEQLEMIVVHSHIVRFGNGEKIIRQNDPAGPMFVLVKGHAEVFIETGGAQTSVATLGPDSSIGENSMLTGEKRTATVVCTEDCVAVEVKKETLAPILAASPEALEALSELLAQRAVSNETKMASGQAAGAQEARNSYKAGFLGKLKSFFEL